MRLLERETQLAALREYAEDARRGDGRLVLVSGEAGIGKSSLVDAFLDGLPPDVRIAWSACDGAFTPSALGPLQDVADAWGGELRDACADGVPRDARFTALLSTLREHGQTGELSVLVVEDLHFADEATLDLLGHVAKRLRAVRALVVATYRDDGLAENPALREMLGEASTLRSTRRIAPPPLTAQALVDLTRGSHREPATLHALTGGNPFFVSELLRDDAVELPASARDAVLARAGRLSVAGREVLDTAALIGERVAPDLLARVSRHPAEALDEPVAAGLLVDDGGSLRFRHEIARLAVEQQVGPHWAVGIHRLILTELLEHQVRDDARLAHHAEGALDAEATVHHARRAGDRSAELASRREAVTQYRRALRFVDAGQPVLRAELLDALARELAKLDRFETAAEALEEAVVLWRAVPEPRNEGASLGQLSAAYWRTCRGPESASAARRALDVLEGVGPCRELAQALVRMAGMSLSHGETEAAARDAARAQEMGRRLALPDVLSASLDVLSCIAFEQGGDWRTFLLEALDVGLARGLHLQAAHAYVNLQEFHSGALRYPESERWFRDGAAFCVEHDIGVYGLCLAGGQAQVLAATARWSEVEEISSGPLSGNRSSRINRVTFLVPLGEVRARRGVDGVWKPLDEAAASADALGDPIYAAMCRAARAEAHWLAGDATLAGAELDLAVGHAAAAPSQRPGVALIRYRIAGESSPQDWRLPAPHAAELRGDVAEAVRLWEEVGRPYDAAMALLGSCDEQDMRVALARFEALGAEPAAAIARRKLRAGGARAVPAGRRPSTREHPQGLTAREQEVLELLADGLSDQDIAARLVISLRTVHHHVSAVLAKLGVANRQQAAATYAGDGQSLVRHG